MLARCFHGQGYREDDEAEGDFYRAIVTATGMLLLIRSGVRHAYEVMCSVEAIRHPVASDCEIIEVCRASGNVLLRFAVALSIEWTADHPTAELVDPDGPGALVIRVGKESWRLRDLIPISAAEIWE